MIIYLCLYFDSYSIDGLSAAGLRMMLQPVTADGRLDGFARVLWATKDPTTSKGWIEAQALYTYNKEHQVSTYKFSISIHLSASFESDEIFAK